MVLEGWNWRGEESQNGHAEEETVGGVMSLSPSESKRLIARAVAAMPAVKRALEKGRVIIGGGTTNAYVAEEILGVKVPPQHYIRGNIGGGLLCSTGDGPENVKPYVLVDGSPVDREPADVLKEFDATDVFIKGGNAIDPEGNVGIVMASGIGGTIGGAIGTVMARGAHLIMPVGLEKMVASVKTASRKAGIKKLKYPSGGTVGLMPVMAGTVVTEIEALRILTGVEATHMASGGIGGSEGSVVLIVEGTDRQVRRAFELWEEIKGEPTIPVSPVAIRYGIDRRSG